MKTVTSFCGHKIKLFQSHIVNMQGAGYCTHCRICKSDQLIDVIDLGPQYNTSKFPVYGKVRIDKPTHIVLCLCSKCDLLQLRHCEQQDELYKQDGGYGYESGISNTMRAHLQKYHTEMLDTVSSIHDGEIVVDIGSNDATMLNFYDTRIRRIGVDPTGVQFSENYKKNNIELLPDYFTKQSFNKMFGDVKCKVISSIAMFYDLPDPIQFAKDINDILHDDGIWTCEQSYLPTMIKKCSIDTICHEHLEYYSLKQIKWIADEAGLKIINILFNESNGGSFRIYFAKRASDKYVENVDLINQVLGEESHLKLGDPATFNTFMKDCDEQIVLLKDFLQLIKANKQRVYIYGASTKGNCLLQYAGIDERLCQLAVERNPKKIGKMTSTGIRIISEEEMRQNPPEFLLVLPWHFKAEILPREHHYLNNGGQFIFPLPTMEVVGTKKKMLITGCDGMIAKHMKEQNNDTYYMYGISKSKSDENGILKAYFDMNNALALERFILLIKPDVIVHLAGISSSRYALHNVVETIQTNGMITVMLCDIIHRRFGGNITLFNISSSEMFKGHTTIDVTDDSTNFNHLHPYSISKIMSHSVVSMYRDMYNYNWFNGILFTTESGYKEGDFLLSKLSKSIRNKEFIKVGNLDSFINIIHGSDVASAIYTIITKGDPSNYVISNESSSCCKVKDLVKLMYEMAGYQLEETSNTFVDTTTGKVMMEWDAPPSQQAKPTKINGHPAKLLNMGWKPKYTHSDIIQEYLDRNKHTVRFGHPGRKRIGIIVNEYHTELIEFILEIFHKEYDFDIFINTDVYGNMNDLQNKYALSCHSFTDFAKKSFCIHKYIVLSHSEIVYELIKKFNLNINQFAFVTHNMKQYQEYRQQAGDHDSHLVVSKCVPGKCILPIKNEITNIVKKHPFNPITAVKIGWVTEDIKEYEKILQSGINIFIFTNHQTDTTKELIKRYAKQVKVFLRVPTADVKQIIHDNCIKFILYPRDSTYWSGTISFALDNNMTIITKQDVIDYYKFPKDYCLAYDTEDFNFMKAYMKYINESNVSELQKFKNSITYTNSKILHETFA